MEETSSFETSVIIGPKNRHIPEDGILLASHNNYIIITSEDETKPRIKNLVSRSVCPLTESPSETRAILSLIFTTHDWNRPSNECNVRAF
jgi:hypothetical protein